MTKPPERFAASTLAAVILLALGSAGAQSQTAIQKDFRRAYEESGLLPNFSLPSADQEAAADRARCFGLDGETSEIGQALFHCNGYEIYLQDDGPCSEFMNIRKCEGTEAIKRDIELIATYLRRGNLQLAPGKDQDLVGAIADFSAAYQLTSNPLVEYALENNIEIKGNDALLARARTYMTLGKLDLAEADLERLTRHLPRHPAPWLEKARIAALRKDFPQAVELLDQAIDRAPDFALAYYHRAFAYNQLGDRQKAVRDCNTAHRLDARLSCS